MLRPRRLKLAGIPQHITRRGNNRQACFSYSADRLAYLALLHRAARRRDCDIHAVVLMTNHVHVLATPGFADGVSRLMQDVGSEYVRYTNRKGHAQGRDSFKSQIETQLNIKPGSGRVGRPSKSE